MCRRRDHWCDGPRRRLADALLDRPPRQRPAATGGVALFLGEVAVCGAFFLTTTDLWTLYAGLLVPPVVWREVGLVAAPGVAVGLAVGVASGEDPRAPSGRRAVATVVGTATTLGVVGGLVGGVAAYVAGTVLAALQSGGSGAVVVPFVLLVVAVPYAILAVAALVLVSLVVAVAVLAGWGVATAVRRVTRRRRETN